MIIIYPDSWLGNGLIIGIVLAVATVAAVLMMRWSWKAWPLVLLSALAGPLLIFMIAAAVLYQVDMLNHTAGGFAVHLNWLIFVVALPSALVGAGAGLAVRRVRSFAN